MNRRKAQGFTLVELMVGIAVGLFVLLGAVSATVALMRGGAVATARASEQLHTAAHVFERDVARAGYFAGAVTQLQGGLASYSNPFALLDVSTPGCVRYSYDRNSNGVVDLASPDERFAVALSQGALFLRRGGAAYDCDVTQGVWEPLTDTSLLLVQEFSASVDQRSEDLGSGKKLWTRSLNFTLRARSQADTVKELTLTNSVLLHNDVVL